ncbi:hypothetical protein [Flavobacterium sp.]|uniref:hypothetical protein n=1 Tax=Flavobacterium sp. TaxID=239 RepID=UPI00262E0792|nr:hypothetical protein [Flavobacterium sp.]
MSTFQNLSQVEQVKLKKIWDTDYQTIVRGKDDGVPFLKYVFELHYKLFGETCSNCPNKISGYIQKLKKLNTETIVETKKKNTFVLQTGTIIPVPGTSESYSNANITDEKAIQLLSENQNRKSLFASLPKDWEEQVKAFIANKPNADAPSLKVVGVKIGENVLTVEEALSLLEKLNVSTKATTISGVDGVIKKLAEEVANELVMLADALSASKTPVVDAVTETGSKERTKEDVEFELASAEQELDDLIAIAPQDAEAIKVAEEKAKALKEELEKL